MDDQKTLDANAALHALKKMIEWDPQGISDSYNKKSYHSFEEHVKDEWTDMFQMFLHSKYIKATKCKEDKTHIYLRLTVTLKGIWFCQLIRDGYYDIKVIFN